VRTSRISSGRNDHRHVQVGEDELHRVPLEDVERFTAVGGLEDRADGRAGQRGDALDHRPHHRRVVHDQEVGRGRPGSRDRLHSHDACLLGVVVR
jgi:hypothetical protein